MKRFRLALIALVFAVVAAGCNATDITSSAGVCPMNSDPTMGSGC